MKILALDSATEQMALALVTPGAVLTHDGPGGALSSQQMIPQALALLAQAGLQPADLDAVAFGAGPGAFTGLRTAVSVAQGLAFGIDCPVLAIDSLMLVAEAWRLAQAAPDLQPPLWVAMDARMDEVYAAAYRWDGATWQIERAPALYDLATLNALWQAEPPQQVCGSAPAAFGERLALGAAAVFAAPAARARGLAELARRAAAAGAGVPADQALPVYLRDKVALTTAEREAAKAAAAASQAAPASAAVVRA